jgi:hypothetical protein
MSVVAIMSEALPSWARAALVLLARRELLFPPKGQGRQQRLEELQSWVRQNSELLRAREGAKLKDKLRVKEPGERAWYDFLARLKNLTVTEQALLAELDVLVGHSAATASALPFIGAPSEGPHTPDAKRRRIEGSPADHLSTPVQASRASPSCTTPQSARALAQARRKTVHVTDSDEEDVVVSGILCSQRAAHTEFNEQDLLEKASAHNRRLYTAVQELRRSCKDCSGRCACLPKYRDASGVAIPLYGKMQKTRLQHLTFHMKECDAPGVHRIALNIWSLKNLYAHCLKFVPCFVMKQLLELLALRRMYMNQTYLQRYTNMCMTVDGRTGLSLGLYVSVFSWTI